MKDMPSVSVCIPVYHAEKTLLRCLCSVAAQDFTDYEIVIVNDGSQGKDEQGRTCKKIVRAFAKEHKSLRKKINYVEHRKNLGLLEARRTAIQNAQGDYVCIVDSDDELLEGALRVLYDTAVRSGADIVQGNAELTAAVPNDGKTTPDEANSALYERANNLFDGELCGSDVFDGFLAKQNHIGFLWGKLFRRELYLQALAHIPFMHCVLAEDFLQYFFISYEAKKYVGINVPVYRYTTEDGISSHRQISDLAAWEQICSCANVFTTVFAEIKEFPVQRKLTLEQSEALKLQSRSYLRNTIQQLHNRVVPSLQEAARNLLCDYWGSNFVALVEQVMEKQHPSGNTDRFDSVCYSNNIVEKDLL